MTTTTLTERDGGSRIQVHVGDTVEIRLPENATTGHRWQVVDLDDTLFELSDVGADYPGPAIGAGGQAHFRLTVLSEGTGSLRLDCGRSWEGPEMASQHFGVEVTALPD